MSATIDQEFIEYIVKTLVGNPDKVKVERTIDERGVLLELHVDPEDLGRVIGRAGSTAKSIRILLRALGIKNDARYNLKIIDNGERPPRKEYTPRDDSQSTDDNSKTTDRPKPTEVAETTPEEQPAEEIAEEPETDSNMDRHREDLKDLTDLDI